MRVSCHSAGKLARSVFRDQMSGGNVLRSSVRVAAADLTTLASRRLMTYTDAVRMRQRLRLRKQADDDSDVIADVISDVIVDVTPRTRPAVMDGDLAAASFN